IPMNINEIIKLIQESIHQNLSTLSEVHERGEWWIDDMGHITFADIELGDSGHEGVVISYLVHEILEHFGIPTEETGLLSEYEDLIKRSLLEDGDLDEQELEDWEKSSGSRCPSTIILKKLIRDKVFKSPQQASEALRIAYGAQGIDARDYAMKY